MVLLSLFKNGVLPDLDIFIDDGDLDCKYESSQKLNLDRTSKVMIYHLSETTFV